MALMSQATYGKLTLRENRWVLHDIEPHVAIRLKQNFPRIPKTAVGYFELENHPSHAADLAWFILRYPLAIDPIHLEELERGRLQFERTRSEMERILLPTYQPAAYVGLKDGQEIRRYQAQAVEILARSGGLLLGDEVGLGKTYAAAAACLISDARPAAIVCQPHLQMQWVNVLKSFTTLRVHPIKSTAPYVFPMTDVVVFRYSQILGWIDVLRDLGFQLVAFDEIQELRRGDESMKGKASKELSRNAKYRLGLSATPIFNYGSEIWEIMQFLRPEVLGPKEDFAREWCTSGYSGREVKDPKALGSYLREMHAFIRRTKADVGKEMPKVNKIVETIDYDEESVHSIDALAHQLAIKATHGTFVERGQAARELDIKVRQQTGIAKAKSVAAFARMIVSTGVPVTLAGWHRAVYDTWLEELADLNPAMYTGSETASQKYKSADSFIKGETDILIMSLRSGAGLDGLQYRCSTVLIGELDWSPAVHHQLIGRFDREGQKEPVTAIFLVADEGSDPPMMEVLGLKASQAADIIDPHLGVQSVHSDRSAIHKLVEKYLNTKTHK